MLKYPFQHILAFLEPHVMGVRRELMYLPSFKASAHDGQVTTALFWIRISAMVPIYFRLCCS
jgi:uncharacterized paraquat-inducible protein A